MKSNKPPINRVKKATFKHAGVTYAQGDEVELEVFWPGGGKTTVRGTLITIAEGKDGMEAYVESQFGPVVGNADTLVTL